MSIIKQDYGSLGNDVQTQMLIAPVLANMVATQPFAIGDQFIVDNVLYKATKAIALNDPISVGTGTTDNCVLSDSITQQIKDNIDYSGTYILMGIPFYFNSGNIAIDAGGVPIPQKEVSKYTYTVNNIYIASGNSGIDLTSLMDPTADHLMFNSRYRAFRLTNVLNAYFRQTGAVFTTLNALRDAGASIYITLVVTKNN